MKVLVNTILINLLLVQTTLWAGNLMNQISVEYQSEFIQATSHETDSNKINHINNDTMLFNRINHSIERFLRYVTYSERKCNYNELYMLETTCIPVYKMEQVYLTPYEIDSNIVRSVFGCLNKELSDSNRRKYLNNHEYYMNVWHPYNYTYERVIRLQDPISTIYPKINYAPHENSYMTNDSSKIGQISRRISQIGLDNKYLNDSIKYCLDPDNLHKTNEHYFSNFKITRIVVDENFIYALLYVRFDDKTVGFYIVNLKQKRAVDVWKKFLICG